MKPNKGRGRDKAPRKPAKQVTIRLILDVYDAFLREREEKKIAAALGTTQTSLSQWLEKFPELQEARDLAITRRASTADFAGYIYKRLTPDARKVWEEIQFWAEGSNAQDKIKTILDGRATPLRQEIFIHALVSNSFNLSEACRIACVPRATVESWRKEDLAFQQLVEEIQFHKKNLFEGALVGLVEQGNPGAIMFVNRTVNSDRGYGEKTTVDHTGTIGFRVDELQLDLDTRRKILDSIKLREARVIDVTPVAPQPERLALPAIGEDERTHAAPHCQNHQS
jgi:DNA-binding MarR family transcriptional regulator